MLCYVMFLGVISYNVHGECGKREPLADKSIALEAVLKKNVFNLIRFISSAKLDRQQEELKQMEHEVEQTKISCDNIIKQHEQQEQERFTRSRSNSSAAMVKELEEKVGVFFRALGILC